MTSTTPGRATTVKAEAYIVAGYYGVVVTILTHNLIWPCNNYLLNHYTNSFLVSPSLASKPVKRMLSLHSSCLGTLARVSTARLTT